MNVSTTQGNPAHSIKEGFAQASFRVSAFCLPILFGLILQSINGAINSMFVGRGIGITALAATSNANGVLLLITGIVSGFSIAANIAVSRCVGMSDEQHARHVATNAAALVLVVALIFSVVGASASTAIVDLLSVPSASRADAATYLALMFAGVPFVNVTAFVGMLLRAHGDSRTPFVFLALAVVLDVGLNPLLIFGTGPLPPLGVAGSALATLVAQAIALAALVVHLRHRLMHLVFAPFQLDRPLLSLLATKGAILALQPLVVSIGTLGLLELANRHGIDVTAALGACAQVWTYLQMPALALGIGMASLAAREAGASRWANIERLARSGTAVAVLATAIPVAGVYVFDRFALGLFLPGGSESMVIARHGNAVAAWSFVIFGASFVLVGVVRATGAVFVPLALLTVSLLGLRLPFAFMLNSSLGVDAIWWSVPLGLVSAAAFTALYYRYGRWRLAK